MEPIKQEECSEEVYIGDFRYALSALKDGFKVGRLNWNAHHTLELKVPCAHSDMTRPYIYMNIGSDAADMQGDRIPWIASQTDILAEDWFFGK